MNFLFSQKIVPVILLILLVLVWSSVWSLFRVDMEVIPPLSFRVIIGLPAFILLLFLGFKKMKTVNRVWLVLKKNYICTSITQQD